MSVCSKRTDEILAAVKLRCSLMCVLSSSHLAASTTATSCVYWWVTVYCCASPHLPVTEYFCCTIVHTALHSSWILRSRSVCARETDASLREEAVADSKTRRTSSSNTCASLM